MSGGGGKVVEGWKNHHQSRGEGVGFMKCKNSNNLQCTPGERGWGGGGGRRWWKVGGPV